MKIYNQKANFDYEILEKFEAGIDLIGPEVKSLREGQASLSEGFVKIIKGQAYLVNVFISPYKFSQEKIDPKRSRKLLLHKKEILALANKTATNGLTLIPLTIYNTGNIFKLEVGIARGKKKWDKREAIKKKDQMREVERELRIKN